MENEIKIKGNIEDFTIMPLDNNPLMTLDHVSENTITFSIQNEEYLKLDPDGFYIKGKLVAEDKEIYEAFKLWMNQGLASQN